jgi:hypothetical protein
LATPTTWSLRSGPERAGVALAQEDAWSDDATLLLPPCRIRDHKELKRTTGTLGRRVAGRGLAPALAQVAFATLVDNALEHGSEAVAPIAAVSLSGSFLTISSRDAGQEIAQAADAKEELRRRIQLTAEDRDPEPGAPAGIPWLARQLSLRHPDSELAFLAGNGQLAWRSGAWSCSQGESVPGFVAIARIAI